MRRIMAAAGLVVAGVVAFNGLMVTWPALSKKQADPRNERVTLYSYYQWGVDPTTVVVDLWAISPTAGMADVDRVLFDTAAALQDGSYTSVKLSYRGRERFQLHGDYFRQIGRERDWQNPVYVMRTMPENLRDPAGQRAFDRWTGGWLGVMSKQLEDHNEFHRQWYIKYL